MCKQRPENLDAFKKMCHDIRHNKKQEQTTATILSTKLGQLLLLLGNNAAAEHRATYHELNNSLVEELKQLEPAEPSFLDLFTGNGPVAMELRQKLSTAALRSLGGQYASSLERAEVRARDLVDLLDYGFSDLPEEAFMLQTFLDRLEKDFRGFIPLQQKTVLHAKGINGLLSNENWGDALLDLESGFYADTTGRSGSSGQLPWTLILRLTFVGNPKPTISVVMPCNQAPMLYFYHPFEDRWMLWDQKHVVPEIDQELNRELVNAVAEAGEFNPGKMPFEAHLPDLENRMLGVLKQHQVFKPSVVISRPPDKMVLADFTWKHNAARLNVVGPKWIMVFYCSLVDNDNWMQEVRIVSPQLRDCLHSSSQPPELLPVEEQAAFLQRAYAAIATLEFAATKFTNQKEAS